MSILNYTLPYLGTPLPPTTYYPPSPPALQPGLQLPLQQQGPYSYPPPLKPFLREDYNPGHQQQPQQPQPPYSSNDGTQNKVHTIIDYDYSDEDTVLPVTPIQGPIFIKNGSIPVVPLYSHPVLNNGTFVQIPILWTALSVALGLELRGEYIRGVPCLVKNFQLFCPRAGNTYPLERIETFIDENKALMKRMYGEFDMRPEFQTDPTSGGVKSKRSTKPGVPDLHFDPGPEPLRGSESFINKIRTPRQNFRTNQSSESGRVDACQSKIEIVTPYWASNSAGKVRAIVNTQHFEQAIHQESCAKVRTNRCAGDCGCEQKYKWHRLLAYDPDNDCKGIFMDWFLFPSCCVCRCAPN